jgi:hypothetical protein
MSSTSIQDESHAASEKGRGCESAQKASHSKYASLFGQAGNAMAQVIAKSFGVNIDERRAALREGNSDEAQAPASKWLWVAVNYLIVDRSLDYLLDLVVGRTLDYLLGVQKELPGLQECYPYLKMIAMLAAKAAITRGLILLREYFGSHFGGSSKSV